MIKFDAGTVVNAYFPNGKVKKSTVVMPVENESMYWIITEEGDTTVIDDFRMIRLEEDLAHRCDCGAETTYKNRVNERILHSYWCTEKRW